jgi:hypothetical protein
VKENFKWEFKDDCMATLNKVCSDSPCSQEIKDGSVFLDKEVLRIDRRVPMNVTLYLEIETISSKKTYVVPF